MGKFSICIKLVMVILCLTMVDHCWSATRVRAREQRSQEPYQCTKPQVVPVVLSRATHRAPARLTRETLAVVDRALRVCDEQLDKNWRLLRVYENKELTEDQVTEQNEGVKLYARRVIIEQYRKKLLLKHAFLKACILAGVDEAHVDLKLLPQSQVGIFLYEPGSINPIDKGYVKVDFASFMPDNIPIPDKSTIYLDDKQFENFSYDELLFLFAHELQHKKNKHIETLYNYEQRSNYVKNYYLKKLTIGAVVLMSCFGLLSKVTPLNQIIKQKNGWKIFTFFAVLPFYTLIFNKITSEAHLLNCGRKSKEHEFEADIQAAQLHEQCLRGGLQFCTRCANTPMFNNAGTVYESHPSPPQRFECLKAYAIKQGYTVKLQQNGPGTVPQVILVKNPQTVVR